jgi:hypothetical protein
MRMVLVQFFLHDMGQVDDMGQVCKVLGDMALELDGMELVHMELDGMELVHMEMDAPPMSNQHKQALKQFSLPCLSHVNKINL